MAKLLHKKADAVSSQEGAGDQNPALAVSEIQQYPDDKLVFRLASAPQEGECHSGLLDEYGEIPLHFIDGMVQIDAPKDAFERTALIKRFKDKYFELLHSPDIAFQIEQEKSAEKVKVGVIDYVVFGHPDRDLRGNGYTGDVGVRIDDMTSETYKMKDGVVEVHNPDHIKAFYREGFVEVATYFKGDSKKDKPVDKPKPDETPESTQPVEE